eukprot:TRINITY_DN14364_c0_g1_i1.p1 TRINITY_DN14364_c0_g1~~TRINITY_DN14364_c0_g1_i1.p1  ORF type:complete len:107 (+),score=13.50 TRINITY_DN14364_c0_g1_i1:217-537(+)
MPHLFSDLTDLDFFIPFLGSTGLSSGEANISISSTLSVLLTVAGFSEALGVLNSGAAFDFSMMFTASLLLLVVLLIRRLGLSKSLSVSEGGAAATFLQVQILSCFS